MQRTNGDHFHLVMEVLERAGFLWMAGMILNHLFSMQGRSALTLEELFAPKVSANILIECYSV